MGSDNSKNGDEREAKRNQTKREVGQRLYTEDEILRVLVHQKRMFEAEQAMMPARQRLYTEDEIRRALVHQKKKLKAKQSKVLASITPSAPEDELVFPASNTTASEQTYQQDIPARPPTPLPSITRPAPKEEVVFPPSNSNASGQTYQQNSSDRPPTPYPRFNNPTSVGTSRVAPLPGRPSQRTLSSVRSSHVAPSSDRPLPGILSSDRSSHVVTSLDRPSQETLSSVRSSLVTPSSAGPSHVTVSPAGPSQATPTFAGSYKGNQKKRQTQRTRSRSRVNQNTRELSGTVNCVTCNGQLGLHIYLCTSGHSSCDGCRFKMARCGNCTELITGVRNITLESTLAEITKSSEERIKCSNAKDGCCLHFKRDELQNHLKECPFNIILCPVLEFSGDCDWKGTIKQLATHFNDTHPKHCEADVNKEMHIILMELDHKVMHLVNIGFHKFLVHIRLDASLNNIYMATQYLGTNFSASKWTYEWHVYNKKEPRRKFEYIDICKSNATPISKVLNNNNCAVINIDYAKTFLDGGKLTFKFYIKKQFDKKKKNIDTTSN